MGARQAESPPSRNETAYVRAVTIEEPLPFQPGRAMPSKLDEGELARSADLAGETQEVGVLKGMDVTLPFAPAPGERLTLEQYASLRAELSAMPERRARTLERYGIAGEAALSALEVRWRERLDGRPDDKARFQELCRHYTTWLTNRRK